MHCNTPPNAHGGVPSSYPPVGTVGLTRALSNASSVSHAGSAGPGSYGTHSSFSGRNTGHDNRAEQMVQNVYAKFAQIVIQARIDGQPVRKPNKWFNLDMYDIEGLRDDLRHWRVRSTTSAPEPLFIDIYLDVSHMAPGQTLLLRDEYTQRRVKISNEQLWMRDPRSGAAVRVKTILLESWQLTLASSGSFQPTVDVPLSYKRAMALFRSLYSSSRLLPAYRLFRKLKKQQAGQNVSMGYRFGATRSYPLDEAGLDQLHVGGDMRNRISEHNFGSLATSYGMFNLHVNYRLDCDFAAEDTQTLVGGRLDEADENYFLPRSLDRVREGLLGRRRSSVDRPYVPEPHRRSSSSLSRPSYNAEDVARTSSGSLPRRVTRYGSHTSVHSQEGTAAPRAHAPVNIPAASLPTRMAAVHRQSYSTASTSSSPGTYYQQEVTPSPVSKRSSQGYPGIDRRQSWGVSPSSHVGFTPPSAGLALRRGTGSTGLSGVPKEFEGTPPFSVEHVEASEPPITMPSDDLAPFTSSSPPFPAPVANVHVNASPVRPTGGGSDSDTGNGPTITFPTASTISTRDMAGSPPSLFTPGGSSIQHRGLISYKLSPPALAASVSPSAAGIPAELDEFLKTLELSRRSLMLPGDPTPGGSELRMRPRAGSAGTGSSESSSVARLSRTKLELARFHQLAKLNDSFSDSLIEAAAAASGLTKQPVETKSDNNTPEPELAPIPPIIDVSPPTPAEEEDARPTGVMVDEDAHGDPPAPSVRRPSAPALIRSNTDPPSPSVAQFEEKAKGKNQHARSVPNDWVEKWDAEDGFIGTRVFADRDRRRSYAHSIPHRIRPASANPSSSTDASRRAVLEVATAALPRATPGWANANAETSYCRRRLPPGPREAGESSNSEDDEELLFNMSGLDIGDSQEEM